MQLRYRGALRSKPCPSLPFFLNSLFFSPCKDFLAFLSVFPFFSRDFRVSVAIKILVFLWFSLPFSRKQGKDGQGTGRFGGRTADTKFPPRRKIALSHAPHCMHGERSLYVVPPHCPQPLLDIFGDLWGIGAAVCDQGL